MTDHKYIRREGTRGNYKYIYEDDLKNTKNYYNAHPEAMKNPFEGAKGVSGFTKALGSAVKQTGKNLLPTVKAMDIRRDVKNVGNKLVMGANGAIEKVKDEAGAGIADKAYNKAAKATEKVLNNAGKAFSPEKFTNAASNVGKGVTKFTKEAKHQLSVAKTGDQKLSNGLSASHDVTVTGKDTKLSSIKQEAHETRKKHIGEMDELVVNRGKKYYDQAINRGLKVEDLDGLYTYSPNRVEVMDKKTNSAYDAEVNASIASKAAYKRSTEEKAAAERLEKKFDQQYGSLVEENDALVENADPRDIVVISTLDYPNLKNVQREIRKNDAAGGIEKVHKSKIKEYNNMLKDYDILLETQSNAERDTYLAELMSNRAEKLFYKTERSHDDYRNMEERKKANAADYRKSVNK